MDVIEIDAASNTGVDNVRELIENAQYRPAQPRSRSTSSTKSHMLSKAAFNALLKTLEEPPEHVKVHPGDDRAGKGAADDPVALPAIRLSATSHARDRRAPQGHLQAGEDQGDDDALLLSPRRARARCATRFRCSTGC
jgi:hypothetical protein